MVFPPGTVASTDPYLLEVPEPGELPLACVVAKAGRMHRCVFAGYSQAMESEISQLLQIVGNDACL